MTTDTIAPQFSPEELALLSQYVTDPSGDVFAVRGAPGLVGAIYARYSRAPGGFRQTLLKEFIKDGNINATKADELIQRVLIAFGDDSVQELESAHLSMEEISVLATKEIEDRRIGGSPIEQSTRYVFYDKRGADGNWRYYRDTEVMASPLGEEYVATMDHIFSTYAALVEPMQEFYRDQKPLMEAEYDVRGVGSKQHFADLTEESEKKAFETTYKVDIRTKACDTLRALLPIATKTNVGINGNGRFFHTALSHCHSSLFPEVRDIAERAHRELNKLIPRYVQRATKNEHMMAVRSTMQTLVDELFNLIDPTTHAEVDLLGRGEMHIAAACAKAPGDADVVRQALQDEADILEISMMIYPFARHSMRQIRDHVRGFDQATRERIISAYIGERKSRRDRTGRAAEAGYPWNFDLCTDFGTYKDLQRHRMFTQQRQMFTPMIGFSMPADLVTAGFEQVARSCVERAQKLYDLLLVQFPQQASYATLHGSLVRWTISGNDRAFQHLIELRSTPQGHPSYRRVAQEMHRLIAKRSPWRAEKMIGFADHNEYGWARGDAEAKQRVKEKELEMAIK